MEIDEKGKILSHRIAETVIRVDRRMSYTDVNRIITHEDGETMEKYQMCIRDRCPISGKNWEPAAEISRRFTPWCG